MANHIVVETRIDGSTGMEQFHTRLRPGLKAELAEIAVAQRRPLRAVAEDAFIEHVQRFARSEKQSRVTQV
jgi:predicted transcriptional regulator